MPVRLSGMCRRHHDVRLNLAWIRAPLRTGNSNLFQTLGCTRLLVLEWISSAIHPSDYWTGARSLRTS